MEVNAIRRDIVKSYSYNKKEDLKKTTRKLIKERMVNEKFMSKFLDMFERKMSYEELDTKIWDLYRKKIKEHEELSSLIQTAQFYLKKL